VPRQPKLKIMFPSGAHDVNSKALATKFPIVGRVKKKYLDPRDGTGRVEVRHITVEVVPLHDGGPSMRATPCVKKELVQAGEIRWHAMINVVVPDGVTPEALLIVKAYERDTSTAYLDMASVRVRLKKVNFTAELAPTFDFPDTNPYLVEGEERDCFVCYGTGNPEPTVTLGGVGVVDHDITGNDWWAMFIPGSQPGPNDGTSPPVPYTLSATNTAGNASTGVNVASE